MKLLLSVITIAFSIPSAFALFGGDSSRCQWRNLPASNGFWVGGQRVSFQYKFNSRQTDPQQIFFTIDSPRHWKKDLQAVVVTGPGSDLWYTASATIPNDTKSDYKWHIKIENRLFGLDICESPYFLIKSYWDANDKSRPVNPSNKFDVTVDQPNVEKPDIQQPSSPQVTQPSTPNVQKPSVSFIKVPAGNAQVNIRGSSITMDENAAKAAPAPPAQA